MDGPRGQVKRGHRGSNAGLRAPSRRSAVAPFYVMEVMRAADKAERCGRDVIHMEVGQPGHPAPRQVLRAARKRLSGEPIPYVAALGLPALRERIASDYKSRHGISLSSDRVIVTSGSSSGFILAFLSAFEAGERLGTINPSYPAYRNTASALGIETVTADVGDAQRWQADPDLLSRLHADHDLSGFLIASPANPTGTMLEPDALRALVQRAQALGLWLISDEIYHGLCFDVRASTALETSDEVIVVNSFSKYYGMTGWRLGWMVVPDRLVRPIERLAQNLFICPSTLAQYAALEAFDCGEELDRHCARYRSNRDLFSQALRAIGIAGIAPSDGAFYLYADVRPIASSSSVFCEDLLRRTGICATPGEDFDPTRGGSYVRFSLSERNDRIEEAARRLVACYGA